MSLAQEIDERMKAALKAKDAATLSCLRMVKAKMKEHAIDKRISGQLSDEAAQEIIGAYVKQLRKAIPEFEKGGEAANERLEGLRFEIRYLEPFLPTLLDEDQTRALVAKAIADLGNPPMKKSGMVIGAVMKAHKAEVDAGLVRRLVEELLGG